MNPFQAILIAVAIAAWILGTAHLLALACRSRAATAVAGFFAGLVLFFAPFVYAAANVDFDAEDDDGAPVEVCG